MNLVSALRDEKIKGFIKDSWSVSWPMGLIMLFISLIGLADIYIAGRFGKEVQAAYGLSFQLYFIFLIIAMAISVGSVSVISRLFTADKKDDLYAAVNSSVMLTVIAGVIFGIIAVLFGSAILKQFRVPEVIKAFAVSFIAIYSAGLLFHYIMINTNAILRACKNVRSSLWTMAIVCVLNIALNFILSLRTPLGFKGIAISTVISLLIGSILNLVHVRRIIDGGLRFSLTLAKKIALIGWPAGLLQILWQLSAMAIFLILSLLPQHNVETMAAFTNGLKIESIIFLPAFAFNMANAVVVGNLLGKQDKKSAFYSGIVTALMGVVIVSTLALIVIINSRLVASFLSSDSIVIDQSSRYLLITLLFEPIMAFGVILGGGLNGAGDTKTVMTIVGLSVWTVRIPLCYIMGVYFGFGAIAIWWSMNISILLQSAFICRRYFSKKWMETA